jgi:hypothetical protein
MGHHYRIRAPQVVHETMDGEVVAIDFTSGSYYSLTGSARAIWSGIGDEADLGEIVRAVAEQYDDDDLVERVRAFLDHLVDEGLLDRLDGDTNGVLAPASGSGSTPLGEPSIEKFTDMEEIILLDPVHDVSQAGWPNAPA